MNLFARWITVSCVFPATILIGQDLYRRSGPVDLQIKKVRSVAAEKRMGFSKSLEVYAVSANSPQMQYVLYCTKSAPQTGKVYSALDEYVSSNLSFLHLWPVERSTLDLPEGQKKGGRLYRVIIIQNVSDSKHPDLACDIYSEQANSSAAP